MLVHCVSGAKQAIKHGNFYVFILLNGISFVFLTSFLSSKESSTRDLEVEKSKMGRVFHSLLVRFLPNTSNTMAMSKDQGFLRVLLKLM